MLCFAISPQVPGTAPHLWPPLADVASPVAPWKVTHACDAPARALPVAIAQLEAGMRAALLTLDHAGRPASARVWQMWAGAALLQTVGDLRRWRRLLAAEAPAPEILHAYCFPAGMAAVLAGYAVVYDLHACVARVCDPSWLRHPLRLAEDSALTRAAAVVVHSQAMWNHALERGVDVNDLFLVPDPVDPEPQRTRDGYGAPHPPAGACPERSRWGRCGNSRVVLFAPDVATEPEVSTLLQAFTMLAAEVDGAELLLEADAELAALITGRAQELEVSPAVRVVAPAERARALAEADIVIAGTPQIDDPSPTVIAALAHGRALLAADVPQNREVTPRGAGCVWYRAGSARELACRAAFLARNLDFRAALADAGRKYLEATRGPAAVARLYHVVYRHAWRKHSRGGPDLAIRELQALQASL